MEESGSEGLDDISIPASLTIYLVIKEADKFFADTDVVCISDNYWLGTKKPCLTYGLRGVSYFCLSVQGPARDLHSGVFGGLHHHSRNSCRNCSCIS